MKKMFKQKKKFNLWDVVRNRNAVIVKASKKYTGFEENSKYRGVQYVIYQDGQFIDYNMKLKNYGHTVTSGADVYDMNGNTVAANVDAKYSKFADVLMGVRYKLQGLFGRRKKAAAVQQAWVAQEAARDLDFRRDVASRAADRRREYVAGLDERLAAARVATTKRVEQQYATARDEMAEEFADMEKIALRNKIELKGKMYRAERLLERLQSDIKATQQMINEQRAMCYRLQHKLMEANMQFAM